MGLVFFFVVYFGGGEGEDKFGADAFGTDDVDVFTVGVDDFFGDGQAEAGSFFIFAAGQVGFVEAVKDELEAFLGDTDSGIFHGDKDFVMLELGLDGNG